MTIIRIENIVPVRIADGSGNVCEEPIVQPQSKKTLTKRRKMRRWKAQEGFFIFSARESHLGNYQYEGQDGKTRQEAKTKELRVNTNRENFIQRT